MTRWMRRSVALAGTEAVQGPHKNVLLLGGQPLAQESHAAGHLRLAQSVEQERSFEPVCVQQGKPVSLSAECW
jgi:hypothetical protein